MSRKDARIAELEAKLALAIKRVTSAEAKYELLLAERDAAFGPLRAENETLRHDNSQLRNQFKGFVDSIEWWKSELAEGFER